MTNSSNPRVVAVAALADLFFQEACATKNLADLEFEVMELGHKCMAEALSRALEALDAKLLKERPEGLCVHDVRPRTFATEMGDINLSIRRYRNRYGEDVYLLADVLDIPYGCRVSPGAASFLIEAATHTSYAKAAKLLARHGSKVQATTVMNCLRQTGVLCAQEDEARATALYRDGIVPQADSVARELCIEADGTYFRVQRSGDDTPKRCEVKALVAYEGKELKDEKVRRMNPVHHALVGSADELWSEGVSAIGLKYDLTKLKHVHLGSDGERWCQNGQYYLPNIPVTYHLDPFHINRAIMRCFDDPKMAWCVIDVINDGDKQVAIALLEASKALGVAKEKPTEAAISYLQGNIDAIAVEGPSLGTMESENQHLYGVRMDSFPCAWSLQGASDMARFISRRESSIPIPKMTREQSMGQTRRQRREEKELKFYEKKGLAPSKVLQSVGSGYLPPHQVDTHKIDSGKAYALYKGMSSFG